MWLVEIAVREVGINGRGSGRNWLQRYIMVGIGACSGGGWSCYSGDVWNCGSGMAEYVVGSLARGMGKVTG